MKKKKHLLKILLIVILPILGFIIGKNNQKTELYDESDSIPEISHKNMLSMMLETDSGSGEYSLETRSSWPTKEDGYVFNSTLSKCEKGSQLRWDDENNAVVMVGTTSDKCYVYFDVYNPPSLIADVCSSGDNLASCVKILYQESNSDLTHIYYHNSILTNGAGDNSYRYAKSSTTINNYVCFGSDADTCPNDNLYRIIGVFDGRVRLIKADYATSTSLGKDTSDYFRTYSYDAPYYQGESSNLTNIAAYYWNNANYDSSYAATNYYNDWSYSELNKTHLNKNFLANIGTTWSNMIDKTTWKVGGNTYANILESNAKTAYTNEITSPSTQVTSTYESKVGLMYVSDYYYGANPTYWMSPGYSSSGASYDYRVATGENWMYMGLGEWTIVRSSEISNFAYYVNDLGNLIYNYVGDIAFAIRPVFHLNSDVEYVSGTGTQESPIRIN